MTEQQNNINSECILQIKELNNLNIYFNNITNIKIIGDIHGDLDILLNYLHHLGFINIYRENDVNNNIRISSIIYEDYVKNISFNYHNNNNNLLLYENVYDTVHFHNNYYIEFNHNNIEQIQNNTAFVFLGDICDTHYSYIHQDIKPIDIENSIYNNDIACYQLLFILKTIIEEKNNNHLILLFGNHEFNAIKNIPIININNINNIFYYCQYQRMKLIKKIINNIIKQNQTIELERLNNIYNDLDTKYKYDEFKQYLTTKSKNKIDIYNYITNNMFNMIPPKDKRILDNDNNNEVDVFKILYNTFKRRFNIRKSFLLSNKNNFNYIVSFNNCIIMSHNFLYQNIINELINNSLNIHNSNIQNRHIISQILESIFKYLLTKIYNNDYECLTNNNISLIQKNFDQLIKERLNTNNNIICDINKEDINNIQKNTCENKVHVIGHMPQDYTNKSRDNFGINDINNMPINNNNNLQYKPKFIINLSDPNITQIYNNFYIYMIDFHLSKSFNEYYPHDLNNKYYLEININGNDNKIRRQFIQFMNEQQRQREDEIQDRNTRQRIQGGYKLFL